MRNRFPYGSENENAKGKNLFAPFLFLPQCPETWLKREFPLEKVKKVFLSLANSFACDAFLTDRFFLPHSFDATLAFRIFFARERHSSLFASSSFLILPFFFVPRERFCPFISAEVVGKYKRTNSPPHRIFPYRQRRRTGLFFLAKIFTRSFAGGNRRRKDAKINFLKGKVAVWPPQWLTMLVLCWFFFVSFILLVSF